MSEAKHTPGPWLAGRKDMATIVDGVKSKWIYGGKNQKKYVAVASGGDVRDWNEVMANAHLIAAAPEMLDALDEAKQFIQNGIKYGYINMPDKGCGDSALETPAKIEAAIQKARGQG